MLFNNLPFEIKGYILSYLDNYKYREKKMDIKLV